MEHGACVWLNGIPRAGNASLPVSDNCDWWSDHTERENFGRCKAPEKKSLTINENLKKIAQANFRKTTSLHIAANII